MKSRIICFVTPKLLNVTTVTEVTDVITCSCSLGLCNRMRPVARHLSSERVAAIRSRSRGGGPRMLLCRSRRNTISGSRLIRRSWAAALVAVVAVLVAGCGHQVAPAATASRVPAEPTVTRVPPAGEPSLSSRSSPPTRSSPVLRSGAAASLAVVPHTVTTYSGSGNQNTPSFTTTSAWQLAYSFNCSEFGGPTRVEVVEGEDAHSGKLLVSTRTLKAEGSTRIDGNPGSHYLEINSPCSWVVKVVDQA